MVFRFKLTIIIFAITMFGAPAALAQTSFVFDGINVALKTGILVAHPYTNPSPIEADSFRLHSRPGFVVSGGLGFWFSLPVALRWRSEMEGSYSRYALKGFVPPKSQIGAEQGSGAITSTNITWYNYLHLTDRFSRHQPFLGFGLGGYRWGLDYYYGGQSTLPPKWNLGLSGEIGYSYRLTQQLGVGASYRYVHILASPYQLKQSQLLFSVSYGF